MDDVKITDRTLLKRGLLIFILSVAAAIGLWYLGTVTGKALDLGDAVGIIGLLATVALVVIAATVNIVKRKKLGGAVSKPSLAEFNELREKQLADPEKSVKESRALLEKRRKTAYLYTAAVGLAGVLTALFTGLANGVITSAGFLIIPLLGAASIISCAAARFCMSVPKPDLTKVDAYLKEDEYPVIYGIVKKAAQTSGCTDNVKIIAMSGSGVGISDYKEFIVLQIGYEYLSDNNEKELFAVLMHEFSHILSDAKDVISDYKNKLENGMPEFFSMSQFNALLFSYIDAAFIFDYFIYLLASSIMTEEKADAAMSAPEYKDAAASSLIKLFFRQCYEWEDAYRDSEPVYKAEEPPVDLIERESKKYEEYKEERRDFWVTLIDKEIISRSASHPTTKMRLDALGVTEYKTLDDPGSPEFRAEKERVFGMLDKHAYESLKDVYPDLKKEYYDEPLETLKTWEEYGKQLIAEDYGRIIGAMIGLGRITEAVELAEKAIAELPDTAALYAYQTRGVYRVHHYIDEGIEDLYHAAENNSNYIDGCLDQIGKYCLMTGNRAELERYREKFMTMQQKNIDVYSRLSGIDKKDELTEEHLPDGMLDSILAVIREADGGYIDKVYLVHKQISEDEATSMFILKYKEGVTVPGEVYDKIFRHLDTGYDWQFSLLESSGVPMAKVEAVKGSLVYEGGKN